MSRVLDQLQSVNMPSEGENQPVKLNITPEGLEINVFDRAKRPLFVGETEKLTMYGRWVFSTLAWPIAENRETHIELAGHTPRGYAGSRTNYTSWELSADRAKVARRVLERYGVHDSQIARVTGFGDSAPMPGTRPEDPVNRRVTLLIRLPSPLDTIQGNSP
jgi:chemotaxis protein MotB